VLVRVQPPELSLSFCRCPPIRQPQREVSEPRRSVRAVDVPEIQCECRMRELAAAGYGPEAYLRIITGQIGRIGSAVQGVPVMTRLGPDLPGRSRRAA
jgi:hypothetical protein